MKRIFLGFILVIVLQACSEKVGMNTVANSKWVLSEWPGQTMPNTTKKATLNFDAENKVSGKSFCNGFGGMATIDGNKIKIGELIGTMMYCEDVGQAEKNYTDGLKSVNSFKILDGKLQLLKDDQIAMVFTKTE
jgi:heat shock protein HslJ